VSPQLYALSSDPLRVPVYETDLATQVLKYQKRLQGLTKSDVSNLTHATPMNVQTLLCELNLDALGVVGRAKEILKCRPSTLDVYGIEKDDFKNMLEYLEDFRGLQDD